MVDIALLTQAIVTRARILHRLERKHPLWSPHHITSTYNRGLISLVLIFVLYIAVYMALARPIYEGRNRARISIWVLSGIILLQLPAFFAAHPVPLVLVLEGLVLTLDIAIVVLLIVGGREGFFDRPQRPDPLAGQHPPPQP